jgi:putative transposase
MRHIDGVYTQRFNRLERRDGSLFRGRYRAIIIDAENYLLAVSRYIHRNPIEAGICKFPIDYPWSSYSAFVDPGQKPMWLTTEEIFRYVYPGSIDSYRVTVRFPTPVVPNTGL